MGCYDMASNQFYVVFDKDQKIESGWAYQSDAADRMKKLQKIEPCRVLSRMQVLIRCGNPADDSLWRNPEIRKKADSPGKGLKI